jgi:hypothetical protein
MLSATERHQYEIWLISSQKGYEYAFTWGFDSAEDRDYYTFKDPYHTLITPIVLNAVENVVVVDYTAGEW